MTKATLMRESICLGLVYSFGGLVHDRHGRENGGLQTGTGAVAESYILIPRQRQTDRQTRPGVGF